MTKVALVFVMACGSSQPEPKGEDPVPQAVSAPVETIGVQAGVKHPPIPANSPAWRHDPGGFVPDHNFYGERSWDGVRMRVAGQIAVIERDRARVMARAGDRAGAAKAYRAMANTLTGLIPQSGGPETAIPTLARDAALRDAALLEGGPLESSSGVASIRSALHQHIRAGTLTTEVAGQLRQRLADYAGTVEFPELTGFDDFDDRHALRVRLWSLYLDAVDPVNFSEPWGYFDAEAYGQMVGKLDVDIAAAAGLEAAPQESTRPLFTVEGAGGMPTGDSLIDVAGQPGPRAIGVLEKLSLQDPKHRQWVEDTVYVLNAKLREAPGGVLAILHTRTAHLDGMGHGSRYYNIKQLRNETVRQLARAEEFELARQALQMNFPLHHQDWECPNREGILMAIDGRLAARASNASASEQLMRARTLSDTFLERVQAAENATR